MLWLLFILIGGTGAIVPITFLDKIDSNVVPRNVTPECLSHTSHWMSQLRLGVPWALKMLDSTTKLPSGIMMNNKIHMGNYDECLSVDVEDGNIKFQGQLSTPIIKLIVPGQLVEAPIMMYSVCVPSTCGYEEIPTLLREHIAPALGVQIIVLQLEEIHCYTKQPPSPLPTGALIYIIIIALLACTVVVSAIIEWRLGDKTHPLVRACSMTSTCRSLFSIRKHPADISCLHGLRVGSILWIILGHRYSQDQYSPLTNREIFTEYMADPINMLVIKAVLGVDTFFFLSGFLMSHSFFREMNREKSFDVLKFYIYRYFRLVVPMATVIAFYISVFMIIGEGPTWNLNIFYVCQNCVINWWTNLVYVNNYIEAEGTWACLGQTWYTAVDMQLAWLSPLILIPLYHSPRAGLQLMSLLILISCFIPFTVTYIFRFTMFSIDVFEGEVPEGNKQKQINQATQSRATPYLCGILLCYLLFKMKHFHIKLTKLTVCVGWTLSTAIALTVIFTTSIAFQPDYVYDVVGSSFYAGFNRLGWSVVLAWIIFACIKGYGGAVNSILSWNYLLPISRLTYCAFLVQFIPMQYTTGVLRSTQRFTDYRSVHGTFGDTAVSYFLALVLYNLVEGPVMALLRIAFNKGKKAETTKKENENNANN